MLNNFNLSLPPLGLGAWSFGSDEIWWGKQKREDSREVLENLLACNVNLIDTAPIYGRGKSETIIGEFFKESGLREKFIIATKCGLSWDGKKVFHDLKKETILRDFDESRTRLQTDLIDLYQVHYPDPAVPVETVAETMKALLDVKKIRAVGLSNFSLEQMLLFQEICPVHSIQLKYNLFHRDIETEILPFCLETGIRFIAYSPLENGLLSGKYHLNSIRPQGLLRRKNPLLNGSQQDEAKLLLQRYEGEALKENLTLAQWSVNWVMKQPGVSTTLIGCRNISQLKENTSLHLI